MAVTYKEFNKLNLPEIEKTILQRWEETNAFEQSVALREGAKTFVFYEGPPSANGMPGIHHVISRTIKDIFCRYQTMQGFQVKRKGGWDTHGLPVELGVEKELGITKEDIGKKISIEAYNQKCREAVLRYKKEWDTLTQKMGYWVDLKEPYITFDNKYIESLWWILKQLYNKGLLYESVSIQPYSPAAGTGLSSHELNQPGTYKDVRDTSIVAMFKLTDDGHPTTQKIIASATGAWENTPHSATVSTFFLAWTTTPWTLPSNLGLTVGPTIEYTLVQTFNPYTHLPVNIILAKNLLHQHLKPEGENLELANYTEGSKLIPWKILNLFKGSELENCRYEQLLPYPANTPEIAGGDPFRVLCDAFVTTEDGTGIVHTAPAFGADDYKVGKRYNIGMLIMVDRQGKFVDGLGEFSGRYVKDFKDQPGYVDVNVDISVKLKKENRAFKIEKYEHSYPHCWRTDKPILYYPLDAWFIRTTSIKERMAELNRNIRWKPQSTGEGRFGNWLENMVDWNLSRSRYWGTPLPVWRNVENNLEVCIGSLSELKEIGYYFDRSLFQQDDNKNKFINQGAVTKPHTQEANSFADISAEPLQGAHQLVEAGITLSQLQPYLKPLKEVHNIDMHKPFMDDVVIIKDEKILTRLPDLVDVWFDSGAMPYAQWHYPFENIDQIEAGKAFPADFICEGVDQTRGWFYTLHALAALLFDSVAYKTVVSNGLVLDKNGVKMSKRLGNIVNPFETIDKYGADATRWYLVTNASPWDNLKFDIAGIQEVQRKFFGTLYNTYQFFALYANVDAFTFNEPPVPIQQRPEIDRWILSSLNTLVQKVTNAFEDYEPTTAGREMELFLDENLSNWYVRLSRRRFWKGEYEQDKVSAYQTLYECLETLCSLMAPISPFFSDAIFIELNKVTKRHPVQSVHHTDFPKAAPQFIDTGLETRMQLAQDVSSLILSLRKKVNIKVRQPLQKAIIPILDATMGQQLEKVSDLIKSEVNVKELELVTDGQANIKKKAKANFKTLGTKLGQAMKEAAALIAKLSQAEIANLELTDSLSLTLSTGTFEITTADVEIIADDIPGWSVASKGKITVALDITITGALEQEGHARELVNRIQGIRKDQGFDLTDRINVLLSQEPALYNAINQYKDYICHEILADTIVWSNEPIDGTDIEVNEYKLKVKVTK